MASDPKEVFKGNKVTLQKGEDYGFGLSRAFRKGIGVGLVSGLITFIVAVILPGVLKTMLLYGVQTLYWEQVLHNTAQRYTLLLQGNFSDSIAWGAPLLGFAVGLALKTLSDSD